MNDEKTKIKLKRKLSLKIASKMFPKYSRGIGHKQTCKKSHSGSHLNPPNCKRSTVCERNAVPSKHHERKGFLRRSLSHRFSKFQKRDENLISKDKKEKRKQDPDEKEINVGNIGLKRQISRSLRRTLRRKYKSETDFVRTKRNSNVKHTLTTRKSLPEVRKVIQNKQFLISNLLVSDNDVSIKLKSRLNSTGETINLMETAKPGRIQKTCQSKIFMQKEQKQENSVNFVGTFDRPVFINSPTCADPFGIDEEDNVYMFDVQSIALLHKQSTNSDPKTDKYLVGSKANTGESGHTQETDPLQRRSIVSADVCFQDLEFDNPWVLQRDLADNSHESPEVTESPGKPCHSLLTPQISVTSMSGYNSFGFDVSDLGENYEDVNKLRRTNSRESVDSFSSSVHSVPSQELMFSDSEAENDLDQISISSADSGTFESQQLSEKSFDSDVGLKSSEKHTVSSSKTRTQATPRLKTRRKHGISLEETGDIAGKIARKLFGKQVSTETAIQTLQDLERTEESSKDALSKRRSLDSNLKIQQMTLELDSGLHARLKWTGSSDSGLSSALSPVFEACTAENKKHKSIDGLDDSKKFYTMPNPKKKKSQQSPKKKVSLGSISKKLSEKAQSLSNLKLSNSFKIRNIENEASKLHTFLKTNSWTNLVVKKGTEVASNISTLVRKRSHPNSMVSSPFMPRSRKDRKNEGEVEKVLIYEKVTLYRPKPEPASPMEIMKWKKQMKLYMKIDQNRGNTNGLRSRTNSCMGLHPSCLNSFRSPTLLDEIMKSVDRVRFTDCRGNLINDCDLSDEEDSSSSSSPMLFSVKPRYDSTTMAVKSGYIYKLDFEAFVCKGCGRMRYPSHENGRSLTRRENRKGNRGRTSSLCNLQGLCCCEKTVILSRMNNTLIHNAGNCVTTNILKPSETDLNSVDSSSWDAMCNNLIQSKRTSSMFELRNIEEVLLNETTDQIDGQPGALLRHQRQHNLSDDNLDDTPAETVVLQSERNCHSCEDFILETKSSLRGVDTPDILLSPVSQYDAETPDTYHSCSEFMESENGETIDETDHQKSHSCGNLVDDADIFIGNKLKEEQDLKTRKEIRKTKVKSLSSSHDALSSFVPIENLEVAKDIVGVVHDMEKMFGEKARLDDDLHETHDTSESKTNKTALSSSRPVCDDGIKVKEQEWPLNNCDTKCQNCDNKVRVDNSTAEQSRNDQYCAICETLRHQGIRDGDKVPKHHKSLSDNLQVHELEEKHEDIGKPPLPNKQSKRKVLSMNDLSQDNMNTHTSDKTKRNSMNSFMPKNPTSPPLLCPETIPSKSLVTENCFSAPSTPFLQKAKTFDFDKKDIQTYSHSTLAPPILEKRKSVSSDNMNSAKTLNSSHERGWQGSLKHTWSDDVFRKTSFPSVPVSPRGFLTSSNTVTEFSEFSPNGVFTEVPGPDVETVFKYDVGLGYLLHSLECDNQLICFYSFQRNKQLMESVITPLAALPGVSGSKLSGSGNINKGQKQQTKAKYDNHPNPAAPITAVPSDKLTHAGRVIRTVLLTRAAHMIRDRKFHLRTYRRCMVGTEMVDWLIQQSPLVHSRTQAVGMWQALLEEGMVVHVCHEHQFKDEYLFYRFHEDDEGVSTVPSATTKRECEEDLQDVFLTLAQIGPDAMMRMILRKLPHERTMEDLEIIYEELLHIKALSHLSTMVKRELASVLVFESHTKSGTVLFNQGDEGKSWYIILKGSVNVVIYGKGVVCTLHEGDDFGKLALVNDAPRAATIVLKDDNCHFLRVDKDDFNRILRDVEANTVRLKEHGQDVLVLEKIPSNSQSADGIVHTHYKYSVMAGTPEKMLEYLLESRLDSKKENEIDGFLEDFLLTHVIFMPNNHLCPVLLSHYHSSMADTSEQEAYEISLNHKKCVLHFVKEWANTVGTAFREDQTINAFLEELHSCILEDLSVYSTLKDDVVAMQTILQEHANNSPEGKSKRKISGNFTLSRKQSKENHGGDVTKRKPVKPSDETIFKVYCADHTYSTLKLPMDTSVEQLLYSTKEKLGLGDDLILCEVKSTGERVVFKENDLCVISGLSINGRLFITPKEHLDALTPLPEQEGPQEGTFSTIEMMSSREMAYYMTTYDWELFTCVQEYELIYQVFGRYKFGKITANLDQFLQRFNEIQFWVITEMVLTTTLSKRVSLLRKFIKIASHCKEHQNLNSFFAIVMGLSNIAVSRLSQTWEKLPGKFKKLFAEFETLMDVSRNHRVYRLSVAKLVPPIIPFMPLLMKDMTFTHEGNKTYFDGLVNFEKMHMIAQTLKTVRFCRSADLDLEVPSSMKSTDTASYIRSIQVIDNQRLLTKLSHKVEPKKT